MVYNPKQPMPAAPVPASPAPAAKSTKAPKRPILEYLFCLVVGSMYIYSLNRVIISATFIRVEQPRLFIMGLVTLLLFVVIFYNRYTRIVSGAVVLILGLIVFFTLERWESQIAHLHDLRMMVQGYLAYRSDLGVTVVWAVSLLLGLAVAVFMLYRFSFYILSVTGIAIFLFTWGPGFTRDAFSFLLFVFCFCLLLIRKTNNGLASVYIAAPICAALVWFIHGNVPQEADLFQRRTLQELFDGPLSAIGDFIYTLTNPMYFSFQSTGFSGHGGRLGGPITPNTRNVMTVQAPGRTYLAGATHNMYTGYRWHSTLEHGDLYTQGMTLSRFEMLETATALMRGATLPDTRSSIPASMLWNIFPIYDHMHLSLRHFATMGLGGYSQNQYLHTYLPIDQATVAIGSNRTGTVFRPNKTRQLWFHAAGPDYLPTLTFEPSGDILAPGFMARNTQYSMNFLNVNPRLSFIEEMLNESFAGINTTREPGMPVPEEIVIVYEEYTIIFEADNAVTIHRENEDGSTDTWQMGVDLAGNFFWVINDVHSENIDPILRDDLWAEIFDWTNTPQAETIEIDFENMAVNANDINAIFERFAHQSPSRELIYMATHAETMAMLDVFSRDVLSVYAETVREHFMYVPEITPQRVHDLVADIIQGHETDFEKIMAIRSFLVQFPYTLSPQPVPDGVCFVDHFLFEGQEGYCTYYATAMAVMSRIAGVPSRYVEGFLLPPAETDPAVFVVTNMMAHAWVEVYLEGFGWLIVEATAPYAFFFDAEQIPPGGITPDWPLHEWMDWEDELFFDYDRPRYPPPTNSGPFSDGTSGATPTEARPSAQQVRMYVLLGLIGLAALALLFFLIRYIQVAARDRKIRRLAVNQQIAAYFAGILNITSHCTDPKEPTETPYAYGQKIGRRFAFQGDSILLRDLVDLYYKARFGHKELTEQERQLMRDSYYDMIYYLRHHHKKPNFLYLRYIRQIGAL